MHKIEKVQERALRFLHNDHASSYNDLLLKSQRCTMHVHRLRAISIEIFKTLNGLNPSFMKDIFQVRSSNYSSRNPKPYSLQTKSGYFRYSQSQVPRTADVELLTK